MTAEKQLRQYVRRAKFIRVSVIATKDDSFFFSITKCEAMKFVDKLFSGSYHFIEMPDIIVRYEEKTKSLWIG